MVAQINATITTSIIHTYEDFDGVMVDLVQFTYPDGATETRSCWTEENLDGETLHNIVSRDGTVVKSSWKNSQSNKWIQAYKSLWLQRWQAECKAFQLSMDTLVFPEQYSQEEYRQAKADLGFNW